MQLSQTQLDHVIIAVRDLDEASAAFQDAGFVVQSGGRHQGWGTHNRLIALRSGQFIELISVVDQSEALSSGEDGRLLVEQLDNAAAALLGWCVTCTDADATKTQLQAAGLVVRGPIDVRRDMSEFRLILINGLLWRQPWPFVIEHPGGRLRAGHPVAHEEHPNGATGFAELLIDAEDPRGVSATLSHGLSVSASDDGSLALGPTSVQLRQIPARGRLAQGLAKLVISAHEPDRITGLLGLPIEALAD